VQEFEGSITDVTKTLVENGYARAQEYEADLAAQTILERVGYDSRALLGMLQEMDDRWSGGGLGFERTHPSPQNRMERLGSAGLAGAALKEPDVRHARFIAALGAR